MDQFGEMIGRVKKNIAAVMVGMEGVTDLLIASFAAGGHVLLEDMPGTGKTTLARTLAMSMDCQFSRVQFTPDLLPADVTGLHYYNQKQETFVFRKGPVFTNILLADEINRATPRTQSALLECMAEQQVTTDGETRALEDPFFVIATENPVETYGCFPLPEAQLDRFLMKLEMDHLSPEQEQRMLERFVHGEPLKELTSVLTRQEAVSLREKCREIFVHKDLLEYMTALTQASRQTDPGISPRGTLALLRASQGYAMVQGRDFVIPEDIQAVAGAVLGHRWICEEPYARKLQKIRQLLDTIPVPTEDWNKR